MKLRESVREGCESLIWKFFESGGQVVIYDANNGTRKARQALADKFDKGGIHVVFLGEYVGCSIVSYDYPVYLRLASSL